MAASDGKRSKLERKLPYRGKQKDGVRPDSLRWISTRQTLLRQPLGDGRPVSHKLSELDEFMGLGPRPNQMFRPMAKMIMPTSVRKLIEVTLSGLGHVSLLRQRRRRPRTCRRPYLSKTNRIHAEGLFRSSPRSDRGRRQHRHIERW